MSNKINDRFEYNGVIMIPSLKRYTKHKKETLMIDACLDNLFKHYNATNVHVLGQEYSDEDKKYLVEKFKQVEFKWYPTRMGIINTFKYLKDWGCTLGDYYIHHDDDVKHSQTFESNPTLLALEHVMKTDLDRIGLVTVPSISIHHFSKQQKNYINLYSNPAQLVIINTKVAKKCNYDNRFENFRSDTDFTMQVASHKFLPLIISRYFSFMHTIPMSTINFEDGKRKFETLDNVNNSKGSIGGDRRMEIRKKEYDLFQEKWPLVITHKSYKQQVFKKSITSLSNFQEREIHDYFDKFDFSLVNDWHDEYYGENTPEKQIKIKLFG